MRAICEMRNNNEGMVGAFVSQVGYNKNNNLREINDVGRVVGELEMNLIHEFFMDGNKAL